MGYLDDYMPAAQRKVVTPNNDTIYGAGFADLTAGGVVIQTPSDVPKGHYWTIQIVGPVHQRASTSWAPRREHRAASCCWWGPSWKGDKPMGFIDVLRSPTNVVGVFGRSFAARTPEAKAESRAVLNQIGMVPLADDKPGRLAFDCEASARNKVFPPGLTADMIAADPDLLRARPVDVKTFWDELKKALDFNPELAPRRCAHGRAGAHPDRVARERCDRWGALLDRVTLKADAELHASATYHQVGVDAGNGWQRQENGGAWGADWFGRALAAVIYIYVNDFHEARLLHPRHRREGRAAVRSLRPYDDLRQGGAAAG